MALFIGLISLLLVNFLLIPICSGLAQSGRKAFLMIVPILAGVGVAYIHSKLGLYLYENYLYIAALVTLSWFTGKAIKGGDQPQKDVMRRIRAIGESQHPNI